MNKVLTLTDEQIHHDTFIKRIYSHFKELPSLGRIKTISLITPWGYGDRYQVKCTLQREYIVYERDGEIHNVGIYRKDLL